MVKGRETRQMLVKLEKPATWRRKSWTIQAGHPYHSNVEGTEDDVRMNAAEAARMPVLPP